MTTYKILTESELKRRVYDGIYMGLCIGALIGIVCGYAWAMYHFR